MSSPSSPRFHLVACAVLIALVAAVFARTLTFDFVGYDDPETVTENPHIREGITAESLVWALTSFEYFANWFPVTWFTHMLDVELYGMQPWGHHLTNVLLHGANVVLLYLVLYRMTGAFWRSAAVAAFFAVHPMHVETVAWVSERKGVLSTVFWVSAMGAYAGYVRRPGTARYVLVAVLLFLGLLSKPMLMTLPFALLLLDYWPLDRLRPNEDGVFRRGQRLVVEKIPLFLMVGALLVVFVGTQSRGGALKSTEIYPLAVRLANAVVSYVTYVGKTFWPQDLAMLYPHPGATISTAAVAASATLLAAISAICLWQARRRPYLFVGWFWFLGTMVPVSQIVQIGASAMADRYVYVPHIGLFIACVWGVGDLAERWRVPKEALGVATAGLVLVTAALGFAQTRHWRDSVSLYTRALAVTENNRIAHNNLGRTLVDMGRVEDAIEHYEAALAIEPNYLTARMNYGNALVSLGQWEAAAAQFHAAAQIDPDYAPAYNNLGNVYMRVGQFDRAIEQFSRALERDPDAAQTYNNLGACYYQMGRYAEAAEQFRKALEIEPDYAKARRNLAAAEARLGN